MKFLTFIFVSVSLASSAASATQAITEKKFIQDGHELSIKLITSSIRIGNNGLIMSANLAEAFQVKTDRMEYSFPADFTYEELNTIALSSGFEGPMTAELIRITNHSTDKTQLAALIDDHGESHPILNGGITGATVSFYRSNLMPATVDMPYTNINILGTIRSIAPYSFYPDGSLRSGEALEERHGPNPGNIDPILIQDQPVDFNYVYIDQSHLIRTLSLTKTMAMKTLAEGKTVSIRGADKQCNGPTQLNKDQLVISTACMKDLSSLKKLDFPSTPEYRTKARISGNAIFDQEKAKLTITLDSLETPTHSHLRILTTKGFSIQKHCEEAIINLPPYRFLNGDFKSITDSDSGPYYDSTTQTAVMSDEQEDLLDSTSCRFIGSFDLK